MGQNNIGNTSLKLSTDAAELQSGLKKAEGDVKGFASRAGSILGTGIKAALGPIGMVIGTITAAIMHPFDKLKELGAIQKQADVLGINASDLAGFQKQLGLVGVDADQVGRVFAIMGKNIEAGLGKAAGEIEDVDGAMLKVQGKAKVFEELGVNLNDLGNMDYTNQFLYLGDAIAALPKGAQQAAAAMAVFGKSGAQLLPIFQKGSGAIREFIEEQKRSGAILSDAQYRDAANAQKAWVGAKKTISAAWEGLSNQAVLVAAPVIEFVGKGMTEAMGYIAPVFAALREGLETAAMIVQAVAKEVGSFIDEMSTGIKQLIKESGNFGDGWVTAADVVKGAFLVMGQAMGYVYDFGKGIAAQIKIMVVDIELMGAEINATIATIKNSSDLQQRITRANELRAERAGLEKDRNNTFSGETAKKIEDWFLKLNFVRPPMKDKALEEARQFPKIQAKIDTSSIKQVAAMLEGSKEAYDQEAKFATGKLLGGWDAAKKIEEQQLEQLKRINDGVDRFNDKIGGGVVLMAG